MKHQSDVQDVTEKNHGQPSTTEQKNAQPQGSPWAFYFILIVIAVCFLGLVGKIFGIF